MNDTAKRAEKITFIGKATEAEREACESLPTKQSTVNKLPKKPSITGTHVTLQVHIQKNSSINRSTIILLR